MNTLAPEVFLDFSPHTKEPRSAKRWTRVVTRRGEKEKPLVTLDLNLTFMKKPESGSEPRARFDGYFYKHAKQYDWSVLLVIPKGRWGQQLSVHKSSRFACVLHWFCFWQCLWSNLTSVLEERFPARRCDRHSANQTGKVNYNSVDPWYRQIPVPDRLFIPSPRNNFGCVLWSLWWTLISTNCKTVVFQRPVWAVKSSTSTICSKKLIPFYSENSNPSYKTRNWDTCFVIMFNKTEPPRSLRMKLSQTGTLTPAK